MINAAVVLAALACGWVAAWPARRVLEPLGWVAIGLPVGLLGWTTVALVTTLLRAPWGLSVAVLGIAGFSAAGFAVFWAAAGGRCRERAEWGAWEYFAAGSGATAFAGAAVWFARAGRSVFTFDSFNFYEPYGANLAVTGEVGVPMFSSRSVVIPAIHAAGRMLGGSWHYAVYPAMALTCTVLIVWGVYRLTRHLPVGRVAALAGAAPVVVMSAAPQVFLHSLYVHSHVASAMYLLASVVALLVAYEPRPGAAGTATRRVWMAVAGLAAAGVALSRPDGLAYAFVPLAVAVALDVSAHRRGGWAWFHAPFLALPAGFLAVIVAREGVWQTGSKLEGSYAVSLVLAMALVAAAHAALDRFAPRFGRASALGALVAAAAFAVAALLMLLPEKATRAASMMAQNLVSEGGWGPLWIYVASASVVALACVPLRKYPWMAVLAVSIGLFFSVAFVVHGATHPGRLGFGDSFNRVSYHGMPMAFLLIGLGVASMMNEVIEVWLALRSARMDA